MNKILSSLALLTITLSSVQSFALKVGDEAPCVVLSQVFPDNSENEQCIREVLVEEHKFTILEFMSIDCSSCIVNLSRLDLLSKDVAETATIRLVSIDKNETRVRNFFNQHPEHRFAPYSLDVDKMARKGYGINVTPTLIILDRNNIVQYRHEGTLSPANIAEIKELVK